MTDTATIEALANKLDHYNVRNTGIDQRNTTDEAADALRALSAENERMRMGLDAIAIGEGLPDVIARQALKEADTTRAIEKES